MRRTGRGLLALTFLLGVLIGLPVLLSVVGAPLLPHHLSLAVVKQLVLSPDNSGHALVWLVTFAAWVAWFLFAVLAVMELANQLSGNRLHLHLPGLGGAQAMVGSLIIAVLAMGFAAPGVATAAPVTHGTAGTSASAHPGNGPAKATPATRHATTHTVQRDESLASIAADTYGAEGYAPALARSNNLAPDALLTVGQNLTLPAVSTIKAGTVVVGPEDSLWSLAEEHLGDGERWPEIYKLNRSVIGSNPNVIVDGTVLSIPSRHERSQSTVTKPAPHPAAQHGPAASTKPAAPKPVHRATQAPATRTAPTTAPAATSVPAPMPAPTAGAATAAPRTQDPAPAQTPVMEPAAESSSSHDLVQDGLLAGAGLLLAASLVSLMNRRRRSQLRERQPGEAITLPDEQAQRTETTLRQMSIPVTVEQVGTVLRAVGHYCLTHGVALPVLTAARVAPDRIDLLLARPATQHPEWVETTPDATVWTITAEHTEALTEQHELYAQVVAPYPALVSIGHDPADALILIDLETAGALTITADSDADAQASMRAIALELALGPFSRDLTVTLVGDVCPGLETALDDPTVTRVDDIDELITSLRTHAEQQRAALGKGSSVGQQRIDPESVDWEPEIILTNQALTTDQVATLTQILVDVPRVAIAAVTTVDQGLSTWRYHVAGLPKAAHLDPVDWRLQPLYVSDTDYANVLELLSTSRSGSTRPASWWEEQTAREIHDYDLTRPEGDDQATISLPPLTDDEPPTAADLPLGDLDQDNDTPTDSIGQNQHAQTTTTEPDAPQTDSAPDVDDMADLPPAPVVSLRRPARGVSPRPPLLSTTAGTHAFAAGSIASQVLPAHPAYDLSTLSDEVATHSDPVLRILGPIELIGATGDAKYKHRAQEALLYLIDHPGATPKTIADAFTMSSDTIRQIISHLRKWLGNAPEGTPYLPAGHQGGYHLDPRVTTDWHLANAHLARGIHHATTDDLVAALNLITGAPFETASAGAFASAEPLRIHIIQRLTDTALELTDRALDSNDLALARWAQAQALKLDSDSEALWRARLATEYQAGNQAEVDRLVRRLNLIVRDLGVDLCPETETMMRKVAAR